MENKILNILSKIAFLALGYFVIFEKENYELLLLLLFIPYLTTTIINYRKFEKITKDNNYIMLSKSNYDYGNFIIVGFIVFICIRDLTIYTGILLAISLVFLFLEYTMSKRRVLTLSKSGIKEISKKKDRTLDQITCFDINSNNVELIFNEIEILQINKNELINPSWENFVAQMTELKTYANNTYK